ncbi:MAG: glycosyltransferase [Crocinitomicaceae bacterium]|nr:glycosyltransferase [Crocinitomicaceae bacterium]
MDFWPEIRVDFTSILFLFFCLMVLIQLWYVLLYPLRLAIHKKKQTSAETPSVSVIVCARNEEDNLFKNLPAVLTQDYPKFEVIVVNDMSVDESKHIIRAYQEKYPHLRIIELEKNRHRKFGKKMPLTIGIKGAQYEHLVMIDADCYPAGNQWLKTIVRNYTEGKEIVIGVGPYETEKSFLNKLIRFDTTTIASTYLSFACAGKPYMAVGRNMSYTRKRFFEVDGFKSHYHIQSGDDDLFMRDAATKKNVAVEISPESFVFSHPKQTWAEWIKQKQRHFTTAPRYRLINKLLLGIFPASMIMMLLSSVILLFNFKWWWIIAGLLFIRYLVYWIVNRAVFRKLAARDLVVWYPVLELIHLVVMPFIYYSTDRREPDKW